MKPLTPAERERLRSRVSMTLANLGLARFYWLPAKRRFLARSLAVQRPFRVPEGAQLLGTYAADGCSAADVLGDLDELMARLAEPAAVPEPEPPPLAPITAEEWLYQVAPARGSTVYAANVTSRRRDKLLPTKPRRPPPAREAGAGEAIPVEDKPTPAPHPWRASRAS